MMTSIAILTTLAAFALPQGQPGRAAADPPGGGGMIEGARVAALKDIDVPAQEPGQLIDVMVGEGDDVTEGSQMAQIDDEKAKADLSVAYFRWEASKKEAAADVNVRLAEMAAKVAEQEYQLAVAANKAQAKTVSPIEVLRRLFEFERANLSGEKAAHDLTILQDTQEANGAQHAAAKISVERRKVTAPVSGRVREVFKHKGEWVSPGDPIFRVLRLDRLQVRGTVDVREYRHTDLANRNVSVQLALPDGSMHKFEGAIVFASPEVFGKDFEVWAEVENHQDAGDWVLYPGMEVTMKLEPGRSPNARTALNDSE